MPNTVARIPIHDLLFKQGVETIQIKETYLFLD